MKSVKPAILALILCALVLPFVACGKGSIPPTINPLFISTGSLPTAVVQKSYSASLAAAGGLAPYKWTITSGSLPNGLSMSSDGVFSGTATTKTTTPASITVQVTDSQTPTAAIASKGFTVTVNDQLSITTASLRNGSIGVPYSVTLTADGGVRPYTWAVASGTLPDGLTLNPLGAISGTPTTEQTMNFTLSVTDSENPAVVVKQDYKLTIGGATARLSGNYAFLFRGFKNGKTIMEAGSFISDGAGTITSGMSDIVVSGISGSSHVMVPVHGTYSLNDDGTGTMSLLFGNGDAGDYQIASASKNSTPYFSFIQNGDGQTTTAGTGLIKTQATIPTDLSTFGNANGLTWVFGGYGVDGTSNRYAAAGTFKVTYTTGDSTANISNGLLDSNDNGVVSTGNAFTGSLTTPDATTGRGTISLGTSGSTGSLAYYFVGSSNGSLELIAIEADPVNVNGNIAILYTLRRQNQLTGGYTNKALQGAIISELSSTPGANTPDLSLGLIDFDGNGTAYATLDENNAGALTQNKFTATYSVDTTGRTTFTGWGGSSNPILYLWSFEIGFALGQDPAVTYGEMEFQNIQTNTHTPSNADFTGAYSGGTVAPVLASQTVEADTDNADGAGNLTGTYDISGGGNPPQQGLKLAATYNVDSTCQAVGQNATYGYTTCGRFPLLDANKNQIGIGYLVNIFGPNRVIWMTTSSQPVFNVLQK